MVDTTNTTWKISSLHRGYILCLGIRMRLIIEYEFMTTFKY